MSPPERIPLGLLQLGLLHCGPHLVLRCYGLAHLTETLVITNTCELQLSWEVAWGNKSNLQEKTITVRTFCPSTRKCLDQITKMWCVSTARSNHHHLEIRIWSEPDHLAIIQQQQCTGTGTRNTLAQLDKNLSHSSGFCVCGTWIRRFGRIRKSFPDLELHSRHWPLKARKPSGS